MPALGDPAALRKIWEEVKKKIAGGGKTAAMETVQARGTVCQQPAMGTSG